MLKQSRNIIFLLLGHLCLLLGIIGALLPIMPTTPFALLAAYFYSKGSERLHNWLLNTKYLGPLIRNWEEHGVIRKKAKWASTLGIVWLFGFTLVFVKVHYGIKILLVGIATSVLTFIWTRPSEITQTDVKEVDPC